MNNRCIGPETIRAGFDGTNRNLKHENITIMINNPSPSNTAYSDFFEIDPRLPAVSCPSSIFRYVADDFMTAYRDFEGIYRFWKRFGLGFGPSRYVFITFDDTRFRVIAQRSQKTIPSVENRARHCAHKCHACVDLCAYRYAYICYIVIVMPFADGPERIVIQNDAR